VAKRECSLKVDIQIMSLISDVIGTKCITLIVRIILRDLLVTDYFQIVLVDSAIIEIRRIKGILMHLSHMYPRVPSSCARKKQCALRSIKIKHQVIRQITS
jgi:hypothetical protein